MFDLNLLSKSGIQLSETVDCSISFIKEKGPYSSNITPSIKNKITTIKPRLFSSNSLFVIIFVAIAGVIFYPMLSNLKFNILIQEEKVPQEEIIDKVLKTVNDFHKIITIIQSLRIQILNFLNIFYPLFIIIIR